jgi:hypothetical protein
MTHFYLYTNPYKLKLKSVKFKVPKVSPAFGGIVECTFSLALIIKIDRIP